VPTVTTIALPNFHRHTMIILIILIIFPMNINFNSIVFLSPLDHNLSVINIENTHTLFLRKFFIILCFESLKYTRTDVLDVQIIIFHPIVPEPDYYETSVNNHNMTLSTSQTYWDNCCHIR